MGLHETPSLMGYLKAEYGDLVEIMLLDACHKCYILKCMELIASLGKGALEIKKIQIQETQLCTETANGF